MWLCGVSAVLIAVAMIYLRWQASIPLLPESVLFEVRDHDPMTRAERRVLPLDGAHNVRDTGGYVAADGRHVAWGRVYRADALHQLTARDQAMLRERGIRLVVDLRTVGEVRRGPDRLPDGIAYQHLPVFERDPLGRGRAILQRHRLDVLFQRMYRTHIIDRGAPVLGTVLRRAADATNLPLLVHCTGGKDRTGIVIALLLHILGVPRATIVADYSLTNRAIEPLLASLRTGQVRQLAWLGIRLEHFYPLLSARPALLEGALDYIDQTYGSVDAYLRGPVGLGEADIAAIRENVMGVTLTA